MNNRPRSITIISWLFITTCGIGFLYHLPELFTRPPLDVDLIAALLIRLAAVVAGIFLLRGANWARWVLAIWMAYHIVLSLHHSPIEIIVHSVLFSAVAYFLSCPRATAYFRPTESSAEQEVANKDK